jgi:hypothetical protein
VRLRAGRKNILRDENFPARLQATARERVRNKATAHRTVDVLLRAARAPARDIFRVPEKKESVAPILPRRSR